VRSLRLFYISHRIFAGQKGGKKAREKERERRTWRVPSFLFLTKPMKKKGKRKTEERERGNFALQIFYCTSGGGREGKKKKRDLKEGRGRGNSSPTRRPDCSAPGSGTSCRTWRNKGGRGLRGEVKFQRPHHHLPSFHRTHRGGGGIWKEGHSSSPSHRATREEKGLKRGGEKPNPAFLL